MHLPCYGRFWFACSIVAFGLFAIVFKLYQLTINDRNFLVNESQKRSHRVVDVKANRGLIFDRNHNVIAVNYAKYSLWLDPSKYTINKHSILRLSKLINMDAQLIAKKISKNNKFVYIKRHINIDKINSIKALNISGLNFQKEFTRFYPLQSASSQLIGIVDIDNQGLEGVELMYNKILKAKNGKKHVVIDVFGNVVSEEKATIEAKSGKDIVLTIDKELQFIVYQKLKEAVLKYDAESASAVLIDLPSGEILAATSYPSFNPNNKDFLNHRNLVFTNLYEPGSTFKPIFMAAILDAGYDDTTTVDTSRGQVNIGRFKVKDVSKTELLNLTGIISKSSNVGMSKLAVQLNGERTYKVLSGFGLDLPSFIGFPGEQTGNIPKSLINHKTVRAAASFGYGLRVTLIEMIRAYAIIANQGMWTDLTLVKSETKVKKIRIIKKEHANTILEMLHAVTSKKGTGRLSRVDGVQVAGKTGTTNLITNGKYDSKRHEASFIGIAPYPKPKFILGIIVNDPKSKKQYGGQIAAPIFSECMQHVLSKRSRTNSLFKQGLQS